MIEIKNLSKSFGDKDVLLGADVQIETGAVFGLIGINGAGKSTLLRMIAGVLKPDCGEILIDGEPVYENERIKKKLFFLQDDPYYTANLTGRAQAEFYKNFYDFDDQVFLSYAEKFKLNMSKPIRNFSKGMKRQTFISLALACRPEYMLLDEAFDGLDPLARLEFKRGIIELAESGTTFIISSHSLRELEDISDSFALLDDKTVKAYGNIQGELSKLHKFQLVFKEDLSEKDMPFECLHFEKTGRVIRLVAKGDGEQVLAQINGLNPIVMDEIPMDFEDMFIYEVQQRGYLK